MARTSHLADVGEAQGEPTSRCWWPARSGPYGAMLADGSEYRGDYDLGAEALAAFHRPRMEALVEAGADLLAFETIPTVREAEVLVRLLDEVDVPAWLSYSCRDGDDHIGRRTDRRCRGPRRSPPRRGGRRQLHGAEVPPGTPGPGRCRHGPSAHRLPERRRSVGRDRPDVGRRRRRRVRAGDGRDVDSPWRDLARWLLRDRPGGDPGACRHPRRGPLAAEPIQGEA